MIWSVASTMTLTDTARSQTSGSRTWSRGTTSTAGGSDPEPESDIRAATLPLRLTQVTGQRRARFADPVRDETGENSGAVFLEVRTVDAAVRTDEEKILGCRCGADR